MPFAGTIRRGGMGRGWGLRWITRSLLAMYVIAVACAPRPAFSQSPPAFSAEVVVETAGWTTTTLPRGQTAAAPSAAKGKPAKDPRGTVRPTAATAGTIDHMAQAVDMPAADIPPGPADEPAPPAVPAAVPSAVETPSPAKIDLAPPATNTAASPQAPATSTVEPKAAAPAAKDATGSKSESTPVKDEVPVDTPRPAAQTPDASAPAPGQVTLGIYINDIQDLDFRTNSYIVDLYMWFRWRGKDLDPVKSVEFMNVFDPEGAVRTVLLDEAKEMPDGSLYNIVRYHGRFSKKFRLEKYPFDRQTLDFVIEDSVSPQALQVFVADTRGIGMNPSMTLPGFRFGTPKLDITGYTYPTDFGDLSAEAAETYSRAVVSVPITRPMFTLAIKTFGPILLIMICTTLVLYINPHFVEGRIGLAITALLTLVALQFTAATNLPDADYFTMLDKLYMLSYGFIIASLLRVVVTSWQTIEGSIQDRAVARGDHRWGYMLLTMYGISAALVAGWVLTR